MFYRFKEKPLSREKWFKRFCEAQKMLSFLALLLLGVQTRWYHSVFPCSWGSRSTVLTLAHPSGLQFCAVTTSPSIQHPLGTWHKQFPKCSCSSYLRFCSYLSTARSNAHFNPQSEATGKEEKNIHFCSQEHSRSRYKHIFSPLLSF